MKKEQQETQQPQTNQENLRTFATRGIDGQKLEVVVRVGQNGQPGEIVEVRPSETQS